MQVQNRLFSRTVPALVFAATLVLAACSDGGDNPPGRQSRRGTCTDQERHRAEENDRPPGEAELEAAAKAHAFPCGDRGHRG